VEDTVSESLRLHAQGFGFGGARSSKEPLTANTTQGNREAAAEPGVWICRYQSTMYSTELAFRSRDKGRECPSFPAACAHHVPALVFNCAVRRDADNRGCSSRFSQQHWMLVAARREVIVEERLHCHTLTRKLRCLVMMCHLR
jgi:hypothetical protein